MERGAGGGTGETAAQLGSGRDGMRILWLKTELLHPIDKGGRIRTYYMLRELKRAHYVTYLTLDDGLAAPDARERAAEYCHELVTVPYRHRAKFTPGFYAELAFNLLSPLPYFLNKYVSAEMQREIVARATAGAFDVLVSDFLVSSVNLPRRVACPTVLFQHNVEAMIWRRHYEVQANPLKKLYLYDQWRKTVKRERAACRRFDYVVAVSHADRLTMQQQYGVEHVAAVPTGVDTDYFRPRDVEPRAPHQLVFTGSMDWLPNEDAIRHFTEQVLPRIQQAVPDVVLTVVGRNPYPSLLELSARNPAVVVTGRVEDVRPYMERAAVYVVPLRIGGGTRLKIYEAMAMEKPIVSTTIGAEGLPVRNGAELLLADTAESFASAVVRLLTDESQARALGQRASLWVRAQFGWDKVADSFAEICQRAHRRAATGATEASAMEEDARAAG